REKHWPGAHNGPAAVAVDARGGHVYMAAGGVEGGSQVVKMTMEGEILWTHRAYEGWGHIRDMAFSDARLKVGQTAYPQGAVYLPHCSSGNLHVGDPRDGEAAIKRSSVKQYVAEGKVRPLRAPLVRFDLGAHGGAVEPGWRGVGLVKYSEDRGFGWDSLDGLAATSSGMGGALERDGHTFAPAGPAKKGPRRSFLISVPEGCRWCLVRVFVGGDRAYQDVQIHSGLSYGKPTLRANVSTAAGECKVVEFQPKPKGVLDITMGNKDGTDKPGWAARGVEVLVTLDRLDAHGGKVVAAFTYANRIQQISPADWKVLSETVVPDLRDVAVLDNGQVLAASGDRIVLVDERRGEHKPVIVGLTDPRCVSVDRATGDLFVAEWGDSHRVKRFSRDYRLLGTYGRLGGRREGLYRPEDFMYVADIAGDGRGGFFVVEHWLAPRRLAHYDSQGRVIREWYGGQRFFTNASLDPKLPNRVWMDSHFGWIMEAEVDWQKGDWRPRATYKFDGLADGLIQVSSGGHYWMLRYHGGQRYLVYTKCPRVLKVDEAGRGLLPVMVSDMNLPVDRRGAAGPTGRGTSFLASLLGGSGKGRERGRWRSYVWTDTNRDGRPQVHEAVLCEWGVHGLRWFVDEDFTYYGVYAPRNTGQAATHYVVRVLAPEWRDGVCVFPPFEKAREFRLAADESLRQQGGRLAGQLAEPKSFYRDA
ncbi:MAG: hypothetical protein WBF17_18475, partial [Phycisphaerae bacterium]